MGDKGRKKYYYGGERSLFIRILLYGCVEMRIWQSERSELRFFAADVLFWWKKVDKIEDGD